MAQSIDDGAALLESGPLDLVQQLAELAVEQRIALDEAFGRRDLFQEQEHATVRQKEGEVLQSVMENRRKWRIRYDIGPQRFYRRADKPSRKRPRLAP